MYASEPAQVWLSAQSDRYALLWVLFSAGLLFALFRDHGFDDPYITYRYALNLARGLGFVYNEGERVLSTTAPFYALLLVPAARLGLDLPMTSNAIGCLSLAFGGLALWKLGKVWGTPLAGAAAMLIYPFVPLLIFSLGAETAFHLALILFGFLAGAHQRYNRAAILFACATLTRADGALAVAALGLGLVLDSWRAGRWREPARFVSALPWRAALLYALLVVPWGLFAWIYFGSPFPVTLASKRQQGLLVGSHHMLAGLAPLATDYLNHPLYRICGLFAAIGLVAAIVRQRAWLLLLAWNTIYLLAYAALGVSAYFWYYAPLVVGFSTCAGLGFAAIVVLVRRACGAWPSRLLALLAALGLLIGTVWSLGAAANAGDERLPVYRAVGAWLANEAALDERVGTLEVGVIGFYAERPMIDFAGLIQPAVAMQLGPTSGYDNAALWAVARYQPSYLVLVPGSLPALQAEPTVVAACSFAARFRDKREFQAEVWRCRW